MKARTGDHDEGTEQAEDAYRSTVTALTTDIHRSRLRALQAASAEMLETYWLVGRAVHDLCEPLGRGAESEAIERLAADLAGTATGLTQLSADDVRYMTQFADAWPHGISDELIRLVPWAHVMVLLDRVQDRRARDHYAAQILNNNWTRETLIEQLDAGSPPVQEHDPGETPREPTASAEPMTATDIDELKAELAEAKRIGKWLYEHGLSNGTRNMLGDTSEWPWLTETAPEPVNDRHDERLRHTEQDIAVLRTFATLQVAGDDPYEAEDVADNLGLTEDEFNGTLYRLIHGGYVTGGKLPSRSFVDTVTDLGLAVATGAQVTALQTDLSSFNDAGYGTLRIPADTTVTPRQLIAVTDTDADTVQAEVLSVDGDIAHIHVHWDRTYPG